MADREAEHAKNRHVLFTNMQYVIIGKVRTMTSALLLDDFPQLFDPTKREYRMRGFGPDPAWPVFDLVIPCIDYALTDAHGADVFIGSSGVPRPLVSGAIVEIGRCEPPVRVELIVEDHEKPIDVEEFKGDITQVWDVLQMKVANAWRAPYMPFLSWGPPRIVGRGPRSVERVISRGPRP